MEFLEKDLETIIHEADKNELEKRGLRIKGILKRQLRIGNYGIADLVTYKKGIYCPEIDYREPFEVTVYELKKDVIDVNTFLQALGYLKGIKSYIEKRYDYEVEINFNIVLVGKNVIKTGNFIFLTDFLGDLQNSITLELIEYRYEFDGIHFKKISNYSLINDGF